MKKSFLNIVFIFGILCTSKLYSQAPGWLWALGASTANSELVNDVAVDRSTGDVYIVGSFVSPGLNVPYGATMSAVYGGTDAFLVKYNSAGTFQWSHRMGGASNDVAISVAVDNSGNVLVAGKFQGTANFYHNPASTPSYDLTSLGSDDIFLAKYNTNGTFQWAARGGGTGSDQALGVRADANGVYVTGSYNTAGATMASYSVASLSNVVLTSAGGSTEMFLMKYSTAGIIQWALKGGSASSDAGYDVVADASNVYVIGDYFNTFSVYNSGNTLQTTLTPSNTTGDIFILSYSQAGAFNWATNIASSIADYGRGITLDASHLYVTGGVGNNAHFKFPTPAFTTTSSANQDMFLAKLNISNGVFQFAKTERGGTPNGIEYASSISYHSSGKLYLGGRHNRGISFSSPGPTLTTASAGTNDLFIANYNTSGGLIYAKGAGGTNADAANGIDNDNNGDVYVGGDAGASCVFTPSTITGAAGSNIFIAKLGCGVVLTTPNAGADQTVCSTTATLAGNNPTSGSGTWSLQSGAGTITTPGAFNSGITSLGVGVNIFVWKISGSGCAAMSDTVKITRDDFPTVSNAGVTMSLCGTTTVLAGNVPVVGTGTWSTFAGTSTITNVNLATSAVTVAAGSPSSITNFSWSIGNGVCPNSTSTVSIISYTTTSPSNAGTTMSVCGNATTLAGNVPAAGTGTWTTFAGTSTITNVNLATSAVTVGAGSPSSTTNFSWTIKNGVCPSTTSTVSIISYTNPVPSNAGTTMSLCGTSTVFAANVPSAGSGTWTTFAGTSTITNVNLATSAVTVGGGSPSSTTNFSWTIKNGVCPSSTSTVSIISYTNPSTANAGPDQSVCTTTATMAANTPAVGTGSWTLVSGSGLITSPTAANTGITGLGIGTNVFMWTVTNGVCASSTETMSITRYAVPTVANAGPNQTVCVSTATMAANTAAIGTGTWSLVSGSGTIVTPTLETTQITGLGVGVNVFQWTIGNGVCPTTSSTMSIQRDDVPTTSVAGPNQSVCATATVMAGNTAAVGTGSWTLVSGSALITSPTLPNSGITAMGLGVNVFMWTISNGVCPNSTSTMSIQRDPLPTTALAGPNQTICANTATMAANTPAIGSGSWTLISGSALITTPTSPNTGLTAIVLGSNIFQWNISSGVCPVSTSTVEIYRDNSPSLSNAGSNQTVCAATATLSANTPAIGTGSWTLISGSGIISSPTSPNSGITALGVGVNVFQWTVIYSTCPPSISTVAIQRDAFPTTANAGANQSLCATSATTMAGNVAVSGTGVWTLISGAGTITTPSSETSGITALGTGTNIFQWTISNGLCPSSTSTVALINYATPTSANAGANQTVCATVATMAGNTPAVGTGSWTLISGSGSITSPTSPNTGITALGVGVNVFEWTISNGVCPSSSATVAIQRDASPGTAVAGPNQTVCSTSATMAATTPTAGSGVWTLVSGSALITSPASAATGITALGSGVNVFQWTISNGVCPSSSATMSIQRDLLPTAANAGPNQSVCATSATLAGNTIVIGVGVWNVLVGSAAVSAPTSPNSSVIGLSPGANVFEWYVTNGVCPPSSSTVQVWQDLPPTNSNAGATQSVCSTTATLAGNTPATGTGVWTLISGSGIISNPNSPTSGLTALGLGTNVFQWTISNGSCPPSTSTVAIIRFALPTTANAGPNQTICVSTATMVGNTPVFGAGIWTLISGSGNITTPTLETTGITALGLGLNVFQWTISNGNCPASTSTMSIQHDQSPTTSLAGSNQSVCTSSATMAANTPAVGTGTWTLISGSGIITSPNLPNSTITSLGLGVNVFQWTIGNGICPNSSSTVSIQRDALPSIANAGVNQTLCASTATMSANTPTTGVGLWTLISGAGTIASPNSPVTALNALGIGVNVFQWTISNGSCPSTSSTVSIQHDNNPTTSNAGSNQTVCATAATLGGNTPAVGTGSWTLVSGSAVITSPTSANSGVTTLGVGVNVFMWTISNGVCSSSSSTVSIQRDAFPSIANAGPSQTLCAASTFTMAGNTPTAGTGLWTLVSGAGSITTPTLATTGITALGNGTNIFQWTISNGVCASTSSTMSILNYAMPTVANAGPNMSICANGTLLAGNTPVVGVGTWNVISGPGVVLAPASPNSSVAALAPGINQFEWTITNGTCPVSTSTVTITRYQNPTPANAGSSQSVCTSTATLAGNTPAIGIGSWTLISGSALITTPASPNTGLTAVAVGTNILQWTTSNGVCPVSTSTVLIQRDALPTVANAGPSQSVCASSATMAGNVPAIGTGSWTLVSGGASIATPTSANTALSAMTAGANVFMWSITNGVCPPSTSTVLIQADAVPTPANAGSNQTICTGTATLAGNTPAIGSGSWTLISGSAVITNPTLPNTGLTSVAVGTNVLMWTITNGVCPPSTSTVAIIRDPLPTVASATPNQTVCSGNATLTGNAPTIGTGLWTLVSGVVTITTPTLNTSGVTAVAVGTNILQWTISNGVCPSSSATMSIVRDPVPTVSNAGSMQNICQGTATLAGNTPAIGTGSWTLISGTAIITAPTLANSALTGVAVGTNVLMWTISNGVCPPSTSTVAIIRDPLPTTSNAGSTQSVCASSATMAANVPAIGTGSWTLISGSGTIVNPTLATTPLSSLGTGTNIFMWSITNGVCPPSTSTVMIQADAVPTMANAGASQTLCGTTTTLSGNVPAIGTGSWTVISGVITIVTPTLAATSVTGAATGTNILQWTISNGVCPASTSTVGIYNLPNPTTSSAGVNQTICSGTANLAGNTPAVGTGSWTLLSGSAVITTPTSPTSGLTGVAVGTNVLEWTISNGVCPNSSSTVSIIRDPNPTVSNAGANQSICNGTATLAGNTPAVGTGSWTLISGSAVISNPTLENSGLTAVAVGTNILQWTISNGVCPPSISTVAIIRDPLPTVASATPNQTVCSGNATLTGNAPSVGTGLWTLVSGAATITTPTLNASGVTAVAVGTNILQWTITNGVCPSSSATMSIVRDPVPTISNAGPTQTICQGTVTLAGNTPAVGTGSWTLISGSAVITNPTLESSGLTAVAVGTNVLQWTISNGVCPPSISTVAIIRDPLPTVASAGPNQTICPSATVLAGNLPTIGTGSWTVISGGATITNPGLNNSAVTAVAIGTNILQWTISNGVCPSSSATMSIQRDAMPTTAVAGPNQTICATSTVLAGNTPAIGTGSWTLISGGATVVNPTMAASSVTAIAIGTNVLQWTISNGVCPSSSSTMSIQQDQVPTIALAGPSQTICPNATVLAGNTPAIGTGSWSLISGGATISAPTQENSPVTAIAVGTNVLQWTISNGVCPSSTSTMSIQRDAMPTLANAGSNQTVCAATATLAGNIPAIGSGSWTLISGGASIGNPTSPASSLSALLGGVNVFQWTISNGVCPSSSSTVSVQRDLPPSTSVAGVNQTVCATTATLASNTPTTGTGLWTLVSGGAVIASPSSTNTGLSALSAGINIFQWTISNGVCPSSTSTVSVQRDALPTTAAAGPNQTVCATTAVLAGNTPAVGTGSWTLISGGGNITTPTSPSSGLTSLTVGVNVFGWTISNGVCPSSSSTVSIQRDDDPTISNAGPSQSVCAVTATMNGNIPTVGTGTWSLISGSGTILSPNAPNTSLANLGIGVNVFQWTIGNGVCANSSSTMAVTVYTNPTTANAGPNQTMCATATVLAGNTPAVGSGVWSLVAGSGVITTPNSPSSGVTTLGVGVNVFQWTTSNGVCPVSTSTVSIQRDENPTMANAGPSQTLCVDNTILNASPLTVGTGSWTLIAGTGTINNPTSASSSYTGLSIGNNILQWTTSNGVCPSTSSTVEITGIANVAPVNAGPDIFFCGLTPTLSGLTPTVGTGTWVPVSAAPNVNNANSPTSSINFAAYGTYTYVWLVGYASCPNESDTVNVTLYNMPTPASVAADQTICASGSTISANTPTIGTGVWNVVGGTGTVSSPSANSSSVTGLSVGMNSFEWVITNGTCPPSTATINIQVDDHPSTPVAGADQTICISSVVNLNATLPTIGNGTWSVIAGGSSVTIPSNNNSPVTSLNVGTNTYEWIVTNGVCPSKSDSVTIFVDDMPSAAVAGADQFTCSTNAIMGGNIPTIGNGTWSPIGSAPQVNSPTLFNSSVTFTGQGVYSYIWTIGNGTCPTATDVVTINTFDHPSDPNAGADQVICAMNTTLNANSVSIGTGSWIAVDPLSSVTNSLVNSTAAVLPNQGVFGFVWQTSNSAFCPVKNDTVYIQTYSNPSTANAGIDINSDCLLNSLAASSPSIGAGAWSIVNGTGEFADVTDPNTNYTSDVDGNTKLVWTVSNGVCPSSSDTMDLVIEPILIPQIITPNNDGNNDMFEIRGMRCLTGIKINIFNRWGNLVYESGDYRNDFAGLNSNGQKLADDTYFYVIEVGKKTYKGYVVVKTE